MSTPRNIKIADAYRQGAGFKTIAKQFNLGKSTTRCILIRMGVYVPKFFPKGTGKWSRHRPKAPKRRKTGGWANYLRFMEVMQSGREFRQKRTSFHGIPHAELPPEARAKKNADWMSRYNSDAQFRMKHILRKRLQKVVKRGDKAAPTMEMLGCTIEHFIKHLETQFQKGMTWHNHGVGRRRWNIDHIIPCAKFDLTREDQQRLCFHFSNLRPMWSVPNIRKGAKLERHEQLPMPLSHVRKYTLNRVSHQ